MLSHEINRAFRTRLASGGALLMPGAANALAARVIADLGFEALYLSGAGLTNTYLALILPQVALSIPFTTLMVATALQQVPKELTEAAVMDNTPRWRLLWKILVPAIWPTLSTLALLLFIWTWNEFLIPLILVNEEELRTLPIGMMFFQNKNTINIPVLMAGAMIVILPLVVVFLVFQRKFISGVTQGAVK
mgnify:CR=1 FL=1